MDGPLPCSALLMTYSLNCNKNRNSLKRHWVSFLTKSSVRAVFTMKTGFFLTKIWKITKNQGLNLLMKSEGTLMCQINVYALGLVCTSIRHIIEYEKMINFNYLLNKSLYVCLLTQHTGRFDSKFLKPILNLDFYIKTDQGST